MTNNLDSKLQIRSVGSTRILSEKFVQKLVLELSTKMLIPVRIIANGRL